MNRKILAVGIASFLLGSIGTLVAQTSDSISPSSLPGILGLNYGFDGGDWDRLRTHGGGAQNNGNGVLRVQNEQGYNSSLNITGATTVKSAAGRVFRFSVVVAGAAGQLCDNNGACAAANVVATIPAVVGVYEVNWPMNTGIRVEPGAAQVVSLNYN